jgi:hypothetical protein
MVHVQNAIVSVPARNFHLGLRAGDVEIARVSCEWFQRRALVSSPHEKVAALLNRANEQSESARDRLASPRRPPCLRLWKFKHQHRPATGHSVRHEVSQTVWGGARVE